eukprot:tig00000769_g4016.t1
MQPEADPPKSPHETRQPAARDRGGLSNGRRSSCLPQLAPAAGSSSGGGLRALAELLQPLASRAALFGACAWSLRGLMGGRARPALVLLAAALAADAVVLSRARLQRRRDDARKEQEVLSASAEQHERELAALLRAAEEALVTCDGDGALVHWSEAAERLLGWPADEVAGRPAALYLPLPPEGAAEGALASGPARAKDGRAVQVTVTRYGRGPGRWPCCTTAELLQRASEAVVAADRHSRVTFFNAGAEALFGWPARDIVGQPLSLLMPAPFADAHAGYVERFLRVPVGRRQPRHLAEITAQRRGGALFAAEISVSHAVLNGACSFIATIRDTSARKEAERAVAEERRRCEALLSNVLPAPIVRMLREHAGRAVAQKHEDASFLFADIVAFGRLAAALEPALLVSLLDQLFSSIDRCLEARYPGRLEKIKTMGGALLVAGGLPHRTARHLEDLACFAVDLLGIFRRIRTPDGEPIAVRIGLHCGSCVAGVVGRKRILYDVRPPPPPPPPPPPRPPRPAPPGGRSAPAPARLSPAGRCGRRGEHGEPAGGGGEPNRVHCSAAVQERLAGRGFVFEGRGEVEVQGKGPMETFWLVAARPRHRDASAGQAHQQEAARQDDDPESPRAATLAPAPGSSLASPPEASRARSRRASSAAAAMNALAAAGPAMIPDHVDLAHIIDDPCLCTWRIPAERHDEFVHAMLHGLRLDAHFGITRAVLRPFLSAVRQMYAPAPFHSFQHALDVCHCMYVMIRLLCNRRRYLAPEDQLACIVAALCHDLSHPGTTNIFQRESQSPVFLAYGAVSTLEKMHLHCALQLLELDGAEAAEEEDLVYGSEVKAEDKASVPLPQGQGHHHGAPAAGEGAGSREERGRLRGRRRAYSVEVEDLAGHAYALEAGYQQATAPAAEAPRHAAPLSSVGSAAPSGSGSGERGGRGGRASSGSSLAPPPSIEIRIEASRSASPASARSSPWGLAPGPATGPGTPRSLSAGGRSRRASLAHVPEQYSGASSDERSPTTPSAPDPALRPVLALANAASGPGAPLEPALRALRPAAILDRLRPRQRARFRAMLRALVLATDVTRNASYIREYARSFPAGSPPEAAISKLGGGFSFQEARLLGEMMIKCADLSNAARGFDNAIYWSRRLRQEFLRQGRRELSLGFNVSPGMDTKGSAFEQQLAWAEGQIFFFRVVVIPLYRTIAEGLPELAVYYTQVMTNFVRWQVTARWKRACRAVLADLRAARAAP